MVVNQEGCCPNSRSPVATRLGRRPSRLPGFSPGKLLPGLLAFLLLSSADAWSQPLSVRCGMTVSREVEGESRSLPDLPFNVSRGYGFIGGSSGALKAGTVRGWRPGAPVSWRSGETKYVFKLERGDYLVTIDLVETEVAAAGLRVFDVEAEGKTAVEGVDIFDEAGDFSLLQRVFRVGVYDGWLDLRFAAVTGDRGPRVSRISVERAPPGKPAELSLVKPLLTGRAGLFHNTLSWQPSGGKSWGTAPLAGFNVYRGEDPAGPFAPLNDRLLRVPFVTDRDLVPGETYYYRVESQDIDGTRSPPSAAVVVEASVHGEGHPKLYDFRISQADLQHMATPAGSREMVPAELLYMKDRFPVELGFDSRPGKWLAHKSLVVDMTRDSFRVFRKRDVLLLSTQELDFTRMRHCLTALAAESIGLPAAMAEPVVVLINGRFFGLRYDIERIDSKFRKRVLLDRTGPLSRLNGDDHWRSDWSLRGRRIGKSGDLLSVNELVRQVNRLHPGEVESFFRSRFYLQKFIDRLAFSAVRGELDPAPTDFFLLRDSRNGKWEMFREDYRNSDWGIRDLEKEIRELTSGELERALFPLCQRAGAPRREAWLVLFTRFFKVPAFRELYLQRVEALLREELSPGRFDVLVDRTAAKVASSLEDWRLIWPYDEGVTLESSVEKIKSAHRRRSLALKGFIAEVRARPTEPVCFSAWSLHPSIGAAWVELTNRSGEPVRLASYRFSEGFSENPGLVSLREVLAPGASFRIELPGGAAASRRAAGGLLALWRRGLAGSLVVSDFFFHGHQVRGIVQKKEPGAGGGWIFVSGEERKGECPSPFFSHGVTRQDNKDLLLSFRFQAPLGTGGGERPEIELMYRPVTEKEYRSVPMSWDDERHRYLLTLEKEADRPRTEYYYRARGANGLERAYPLGAPALSLALPVLPPLFINEVCPRPGGGADGPGEFIEIFNGSDGELSLKGLYLSDDRRRKAKWRIDEDIVVKPGGYVVFYGDGQNRGRHTSFKLSNSGEFIGLYTPPEEGSLLVHGCAFRGVPLGNSWGRKQDGSRSFRAWKDPTPGRRNLPKIPDGLLEKLRAKEKEKGAKEEER
ncbi:MAG: CotH kinase family protein [Planctomycetota bacterium]|nr:CotH kinase family protein [Planctomycetota bacterium]